MAEYKNMKAFSEANPTINIDKFTKYLLETITERELVNLEYFDLECLYEGYDLQMELNIYNSLEELGESWAKHSSLFDDDPDPDFEEIGQFYIDNYNNNYSYPSDICIELCSGRILTMN